MTKYFLAFSCFLFSLQIFSQQTEVADFLKIEALIGTDIIEKKIGGHFLVTFRVLKETDSIFMDAVSIQINKVETKDFKITSDEKKLWFTGNFEEGKDYKAELWYNMKPKQTLYFFGNEIWTQGQGKYTSHWLPSIDDINDKIEFDLQVMAPEDKNVIANGALLKVESNSDEKYWHFDMKEPMSSYLVAFAIGNFNKKNSFQIQEFPLNYTINLQIH